MQEFDYDAPPTVADAVELLNRHGETARVLAGGTDLIDQIRSDSLRPEWVVDVKQIPDLNILESDKADLRLGAAVPCYRIYGNDRIVRDYSALADSCRIIGGMQIQSRASVGGNLCNAGPAADSIPSLIALEATCLIAGPAGSRTVPVAEFCTGPGWNCLETGEILVELRFPSRPAHSGSHYRRFIPRNEMDIAVVGVGASVTLDDAGETFLAARISLGAVGPTPLFAREAGDLLTGRPVSDDSVLAAAEAAQSIATPIDDKRGTAEFRRHLVGVLTRRVLKCAVNRARGTDDGNHGDIPLTG